MSETTARTSHVPHPQRKHVRWVKAPPDRTPGGRKEGASSKVSLARFLEILDRKPGKWAKWVPDEGDIELATVTGTVYRINKQDGYEATTRNGTLYARKVA